MPKTWRHRFNIEKMNDEKRIVFGWALVAFDKDGNQIVDHQKDLVDEADLEEMAYRFVLHYREGGEMHIKGGSAVMIESIVFTKEKQQAMGIPDGALPVGWWIGFYVTDDDAWKGIKSGMYKAFSIEGTAIREEVK
ncbi:XkdF-like putative serine protease domain-containing protein [Petroclostridium sp. X23]|uniref:XkdF-like putative serine protease domain-containing protein n=1 Tax=Petroclostridium sp. X23 TaxID=3045146 RepID=UPI0024AD2FB8|nr:XkdF-like putative serine protease domain-containing protein [Petroclostridium sp. X23]WHH58300.1 XkdF-like putative serine protease domain-containing protein [Petroclostridium sp. X23]